MNALALHIYPDIVRAVYFFKGEQHVAVCLYHSRLDIVLGNACDYCLSGLGDGVINASALYGDDVLIIGTAAHIVPYHALFDADNGELAVGSEQHRREAFL